MESSRRPPFDRSRDPSMKKPRLAEEPTLASRQFQRSANLTRFRGNGRESDEREREPNDPSSGALQQYMQHQELINQYKTALAELTFNSKPIITNLTIIAGENVQAAKGIAGTICSNIIEVPSEQKLPSLYLLDSIVKNIGRDYIKHFATRLPEVFCKAYRQVNPSTHPGMKHLFGTWRGVFPLQTLQIIEKELGFQAAVNGSSSGSATSKADPQSQRQPHGIHVNPKYLKAGQHLQQSNRPQGTNIGGAAVECSEDAGSPEITASSITERAWTNPSVKMQTIRPQREALKESSHLKQGGGGYGDCEFGSGLSRPLRTFLGKPSESLIGQNDKRWLSASREVEQSRNEHDIKRGISNLAVSRPAGRNIPSTKSPPRKRSSTEMSRSWKNSEEEEYIWDDLETRATDPSAVSGATKDVYSSNGLEKLDVGNHLPKWQSQAEVRSSFERETSADTLSSEQKDEIAVGNSRSSPWRIHEPYEVDSSSSKPLVATRSVTGPPPGASSFGFPTAISGTTGSMRQRHPSSAQPPMPQRSPSPSFSRRDPRQHFAEKGHIKSQSSVPSDPRTASFSGQITVGLHDKSSQNSIPARDHNLQSGSLGQSNVSSLLAAVMKSGILSGSSVSEQPSVEVPAKGPAKAPMTSKGTITSSKGNMTFSGLSTPMPQIKAEKPPLPPAQSSDVPGTKSNPLSSLFSSLVAKGLISHANTEPTPLAPVQSEDQVKEKKLTVATKATVKTEPAPKIPAAPAPKTPAAPAPKTPVVPPKTPAAPAPTTDKLSSSELTGKNSDASGGQITKDEIENLIGFEFRPPVLRELHTEVIDRVTDDLPHRCTACGLRFKLKKRLDSHTEWHAFRNSIPNNSSLNTPSRRWYSNSSDWVAGKAGFPFGYKSTNFMKDVSETAEKNDKMVPADESQCVCILCGELFEDFYCQERDEWMFKGAVYMSIPSESNAEGPSSESCSHTLIVHAGCSPDDSVSRLGLGQ